jgi:hypothetical protein
MALVRPLYIFQYGETDRYAASRDMTGFNLPRDGHPWVLRGTISTEHLEEDLLPAIAEIKERGYCMLPVDGHEPE